VESNCAKLLRESQLFEIITKDQYFAALDDEITRKRMEAAPRGAIDLKHTQDAWVLHQLRDANGLRILEIGGGYLRALRTIAGNNEVWNLDDFHDDTGSPHRGRKIPTPTDWKLVLNRLGSFSTELPDDYFDVVVSISVVEHIPADVHGLFWKDHSRVMKPGGAAYHAIDFYAGDEPMTQNEERLELLLRSYKQAGLRLREPATIERPLRFRSRYASNPDYGMWIWNHASPSLVRRRSNCQSISLGVILTRG
jgi:hypothetical protein